MRYIIISFLVVLFIGCSDSENSSQVSSISDTSKLQPTLDNSELQPPRPPEI